MCYQMAAKKIREIPTKLRHAHVYLDDIEEISKILWRPSRVFFVRSRESSKASWAARRGYVRDTVFILIGAALAELAKWIFGRLLK